MTVLEPGQIGLYHAEENQEAFLVLSRECALLVEGEERRLRPVTARAWRRTSDWRQAYATVEWFGRERPPSWARLPWA